MARNRHALTVKQVEHAKPKDKIYRISDGYGLYLLIRPAGFKAWECRYKSLRTGKHTFLGLGSYPEISLLDARAKAQDVRKLIANGIDPKQFKDKANLALKEKHTNTLEVVAAQWFDKKRKQVTPDYADDIWRSLELHVFPLLGHLPISEITAPQTIHTLRPLEKQQKLEMIKRVSQRLNEIMQFAVNTGLIYANPLAGIKAAFDKPKPKNNPCLTPDELPELLTKIATSNTKLVTRLYITWKIHTMTRTSEAAGAAWSEIDFDRKLWIVPAERMKNRIEHEIPLTPQTLALLETIKPISGHRPFIFPGDRDPLSHINPQTANQALKRMGFKDRTTAHGIRALARTILNKQKFDKDVMEAALSHIEKNQVIRAYNRDNYIEKRVVLMHWWSDHIEQASYGNVSLTGYKALKVIDK